MTEEKLCAPGLFGVVGRTKNGYTVLSIPPGMESPMANHRGGEIAVDDAAKVMYCWEVFAVIYGRDSIMKACAGYPPSKGLAAAQNKGKVI